MKKLIFPLLCMALLLAACEPTEEVAQPEPKEIVIETGSQETDQISGTLISATTPINKDYAYTWEMQQPKISDMDNADALKNNFSRSWEKEYNFSECRSEEMAYSCNDEREDNKAYKDYLLETCYTDTEWRKTD